jgi:hypothetical protein
MATFCINLLTIEARAPIVLSSYYKKRQTLEEFGAFFNTFYFDVDVTIVESSTAPITKLVRI